MMPAEVKFVEIRDRATFIPAVVIRLQPRPANRHDETYVLRRAGFMTDPCILLSRLSDGSGNVDPCGWPGLNRTMAVAHQWLYDHFDAFESGGVVDVEFILGQSAQPKLSERLTAFGGAE